MDNENFLKMLKEGTDKELAGYFQVHPSSNISGNIPMDIRREMVKGELEYRNASKMIEFSQSIKSLTIVLCILTGVLTVLTAILVWPQIFEIVHIVSRGNKGG